MWQPGKKVLELKPFGIDKGKSIKNFIKAYSNVNKQHIYIGDDYTDETAFSFLRSNGISILVSKTQEKSYAKYRLRSSEDVLNFLKSIIRMHT
jgi:trehalose 6-phosphate phosphatase